MKYVCHYLFDSMRVLILEDEVPAQLQLKRLLNVHYPDTRIEAVLDSVDKAARWLPSHPVDLIFMDVELSDGICFELFNRVSDMPPVIIITAYEHYALAALKNSAVDYLLKPVGDKEFVEAVEKCCKSPAKSHDLQNLGKLISLSQEYKQRFVVRLGDQIIVIQTKDIAYFYHDKGGEALPVRRQPGSCGRTAQSQGIFPALKKLHCQHRGHQFHLKAFQQPLADRIAPPFFSDVAGQPYQGPCVYEVD